MSTHPRTIAGRYRVLEEAGRGGMGSVWRCVDERLDREVAVKQVGRLPGESVTDQARALREARSTAALNHPNVVGVYDAVALGDQVWLVMEYVPGRTLAEMVRAEGALDPRRVAWIGAQVADGLAAAHERGIVHRDVKPGNILVTDGDLAKISDFGIARTLGDDKLTQTGMVSGTPSYFAPELARGHDPTPASDVWALGASLFAAVEGHPPYPDHPNALALLSTIATEEPLPMERAGALAEPIDRMLDREPEARWSIEEVSRALHRLHEGADDETTREDTAAAAATAPLAAGDAASPAPQVAETTPDPTPTPASTPAATPAATPTPAEPPRRRRGPLLVGGLVAVLVAVIAFLALRSEDPEPEPAAGDTASDTSSPSAGESPSDEPAPSSDSPEETTEPDESSAPPDAEPASTGSRSAFVEDYYAVLPEDTAAGWELLSPEFQAEVGSYEDYDAFWSTIDDVQVLDARSGGADAVDVTLVYTDADGEEEEQRRLFLERGDSGWLIADDEVIG